MTLKRQGEVRKGWAESRLGLKVCDCNSNKTIYSTYRKRSHEGRFRGNSPRGTLRKLTGNVFQVWPLLLALRFVRGEIRPFISVLSVWSTSFSVASEIQLTHSSVYGYVLTQTIHHCDSGVGETPSSWQRIHFSARGPLKQNWPLYKYGGRECGGRSFANHAQSVCVGKRHNNKSFTRS